MKGERGFTLIEVTIVMAIAALLGAGLLFGQSQFRQRAAFTASVESLKNKLKQIQTETIASVNVSGSGNSNQRIFGKLVRFTNNSSTVTVTTLLGDDADLADGAPYSQSLSLASDSTTFTIDNGAYPSLANGQPVAIIFTRSPDLIYSVANYNTTASVSDTSSVLNPNNYNRSNSTFNPASPAAISILSPNPNLTATLSIDTQNTVISRTIN